MAMYDSFTQTEVFVQCPVLCVTCDNPKASEICHHLGSTARHFCRDCDVRLTVSLALFLACRFITINMPEDLNMLTVTKLYSFTFVGDSRKCL